MSRKSSSQPFKRGSAVLRQNHELDQRAMPFQDQTVVLEPLFLLDVPERGARPDRDGRAWAWDWSSRRLRSGSRSFRFEPPRRTRPSWSCHAWSRAASSARAEVHVGQLFTRRCRSLVSRTVLSQRLQAVVVNSADLGIERVRATLPPVTGEAIHHPAIPGRPSADPSAGHLRVPRQVARMVGGFD